MADDNGLLAETVQSILRGSGRVTSDPETRWDEGLWRELEASGLTSIGLPESLGGAGGETHDAVTAVALVSRFAAAVPLADHLLVALPTLTDVGLKHPGPGPVAVAIGAFSADRSGDSWRLSGRAADVPWVGVASHVLVLATAGVEMVAAIVPSDQCEVTEVRTIANEPHGHVVLAGVAAASACAAAPDLLDKIVLRIALARAVQLAAVTEALLIRTVDFTRERRQFGRSIAEFQVVKAALAAMAEAAAMASAAVSLAAQTPVENPSATMIIAAAKIRAGASAGIVARHAHQLHGAIGITDDFSLQRLTKRCWTWRDEGGTERFWSIRLGRAILDAGPDVWSVLTSVN